MVVCAGGEAIEAVSTAASKAAEEAATGSWLRDLATGNLPRIAAPGLAEGWFGPGQNIPPEPTPSGQSVPALLCCVCSEQLWQSHNWQAKTKQPRQPILLTSFHNLDCLISLLFIFTFLGVVRGCRSIQTTGMCKLASVFKKPDGLSGAGTIH